ncbi:hypothetical protein CR513_12027, partial [Mucuna pruriens]
MLSPFIVMFVNFQNITVQHFLLVIIKIFPFDLIYFDMWRPASNFISGAKWFVSFIYNCTHVRWIFLMKHKFMSNNSIKFVKLEFYKFLKDNDVVH